MTITYTVTGTDVATGCSNNAILTQSVSVCTGVDQLALEAVALSVYPNPGNGIYTIELPVEAVIVVYNALGNTIYTTHLQVGYQQIHLNQQPNSLYVLKVISNGKQQTIRLIKH